MLKRAFTTTFFTLLIIQLFSQFFVVTKDGLVNSQDFTKRYVVLDFEDLSSTQLYNNCLIYIQKNYNSPQDVIKGQVENKFISFDTHTNQIAQFKIPLVGTKDIQANFKVSLDFKDGKARFKIVSIEMYYYYDYKKIPFNFKQEIMGWAIYNKKGKPIKRATPTKTEIELYINGFILQLKEGIQGGGQLDNDDW